MKPDASSVSTLPIGSIDPPPHNPRRDFGDVDDLAKSIASVGLLEPVIARPAKRGRFELVAGERRLKAVKLLKWKDIPATVRELSDREAAEVRLLENLDRRSLNPIEEAGALFQLQELGHDSESLAKLTRWTQQSVNGRLGLLTLSDEWQALLRAGELSPAAAEYLVPFADRQPVLDEMLKVAHNWPMPLVEWRRRLNETVIALTRSLEPDDPTGPRFELSEDRLSRLQPFDLELSPRQTVRRTFAVDLCDTWNDEADAAAQANVEPTPSPPEPPQRPQRTGARNAKPSKNGRPVGANADASRNGRSRGTSLADVMREYKAEWLRELLTARLAKMDLDALQDLADVLAVDVAAAWQLNRRFLEFLDEPELRELGAELSVDLSGCRDDGECIAVLLHNSPTQVPTILVEA